MVSQQVRSAKSACSVGKGSALRKSIEKSTARVSQGVSG
jgi:hypothetical protein